MRVKAQLIAFCYNKPNNNDLEFCVFATKSGIILSGTVSSENWYKNDLGIKHIPINDSAKYYFDNTIDKYNKLFGENNWEIVDWGNLSHITSTIKYQAIVKLDEKYGQYFDLSLKEKLIINSGKSNLHIFYKELSERRKLLDNSIDIFKSIKIHEIDLMLVKIEQLLISEIK